MRKPARAAPKAKSLPAGLKDLAGYALLVTATLLTYLPALNGALLWDDNMHVTRPDMQSLQGLWRIWFDLGATQQYYPLLHSAFWLEHVLWGDAPLGYHLTNVLLHAASACLLVAIVRRLSLPGAWFAGFIFALHPVCVEAVAWISEQKSTLSGVFYLSAALTYLHFDRSRRTRTYFFALGFFILALMSKTVTATLPAALLIVFWWQRGRLDWKLDALPLIPWFGIGAMAGLFTAWVESTPRLIGAQGPKYALTLFQRFMLAGRVPWFYAAKAIWPADLMFIYPHWKIDPGNILQWLFPSALVLLAAVCIRLARRNRAPLAVLLFYVGTLFPALGFLNVYPFRYSYVADHFQYLALIGIAIPCGVLLAAHVKGISRLAAATVLSAILATATWAQCANYRSYEVLFRATLAKNPGSSFLHSNLGVILMSTGREAEASVEFAEAVRLTPDDPDYRVNLGLALAQVPGRLPDAMAEYRKALELDPHLSAARLNLGLALASMPGHLQDAIAEYRTAIAEFQSSLKDQPDLWQAHYNLALAYSQLAGREADAIGEYRAALKLKPDSAVAHFQLGNTFHKMRRLDEAVTEYRTSLGFDPGIPEVHYEMAYALAQIPGHLPEAIEECGRMLALKPGDSAGQQLMTSLLKLRAAGRG